MGKSIDITDRLTFDTNPKIVIRGKEYEVRADAPTMLKVMSLMRTEEVGVAEVLGAYELIFDEGTRKRLDALKLNVSDLMTVIQAAMGVIMGETAEKEH